MVLLPDNNRIPNMARFTIAMFLKADSKVKSGTLFGYSVEEDTKEKNSVVLLCLSIAHESERKNN